VVLVGAGVLVAGAAYLIGSRIYSKPSPAPTTHAASAHGRTANRTTASTGPFQVVSVTPRNGASGVEGSAAVTVSFSEPVSQHSAMPQLEPSVPGSWHVLHGRTLVFSPSTPFVPLSQVTLRVPAGSGGVVDTGGGQLQKAVVDNFTVADGSTLRLQQLLALLDYSPLAWNPQDPIAPSDTAGQLQALYSPPAGTFTWRDSGWPSYLLSLWQEGRYNPFTRGLVMEFQADHGLTVNGKPTAGLWNALLHALAAGETNTGGYNYAIGDKVPPESLTIWHNGKVVLKSSANTGIPQSPTPSGTFPVYARYRNEIMRGTNPDGSHYADPVQYVAYFYDGDAVHYFPRADYGVPQSLGCIELPLASAAAAWPYLAYGTLVTVLN
jgi:peptidoglycan hydrolase-like protein with peptidoglycan-binding domain